MNLKRKDRIKRAADKEKQDESVLFSFRTKSDIPLIRRTHEKQS